MSDQLFYNPTGEAFSGKQPMKTVDKLVFLDSMEDCYRFGGKDAIGPYYPARPLPAMYVDSDSELPIVMPAGSIVSIIPIKDAAAYLAAQAETGIRAGGAIYISMGIDDVALERNINLVYPKETAGLITLCNGGTQTTDSYADTDGENGILTASGAIAASGASYIREANIPMGVVNSRVYGDIRYRYLNYEVGQEPTSIALAGIFTIPFCIVYGGTEGNRATVEAAMRASVKARHQFYWGNVSDLSAAEALLAVDAPSKSDAYGKFTNWASGDQQKFGRVMGLRNRVPYDLDEIIDSYPGSGIKGMDTGGLSRRYYHFAKTILALTAVKGATYAASKSNLKATLYEPVATDTSGVSVLMGMVDMAFGKVHY